MPIKAVMVFFAMDDKKCWLNEEAFDGWAKNNFLIRVIFKVYKD